MNRRLACLIFTMLLSFLLAACDNFGTRDLKPGESTGFEVRDKMGTPTDEWQNDNGTTTWEYAKGPEGQLTFMVTIGADNILRAVEQVLSEPYFARVERGMSRDEIRRLLGRPGRIDHLNEEIWDWRVEGQMPLERAHFHVHFDASGKVTRTSRAVEQTG